MSPSKYPAFPDPTRADPNVDMGNNGRGITAAAFFAAHALQGLLAGRYFSLSEIEESGRIADLANALGDALASAIEDEDRLAP